MKRFSTVLLILPCLFFCINFSIAQIPTYPINQIKGVDSLGNADSIGVECFLHGIIVGVDLQTGSGYIFNMQDTTAGIVVFSSNDIISGYTITEGDSIVVKGIISQNRGLSFINIDSMSVLVNGVNVPNPIVVTELNEGTEGKLVQIKNLRLIDQSNWPVFPGSFGNVKATNGVDTFEIIIDTDTDIDGTQPPQGYFDITGTGSQRDDFSPFIDDYIIFPRRATDVNRKGYFPGIPKYTIGQVAGENGAGIADSLGIVCQLQGVVNSLDFKGGSGYDFFIHDGSEINVFSNVDLSPHYNVKQGDVVILRGTIQQNKGLTQIVTDSIIPLDSNQVLPNALVVSQLNEGIESTLIRLQAFRLLDTLQWPALGNSANVQITNVSGSDTLILHIDEDTNLDGTNAPKGFFDVQGLVSQCDTSSPFLSNYFVLPRDTSDFTPINIASPRIAFNSISANVLEDVDSLKVSLKLDALTITSENIKIKINQGLNVSSGDFSTNPIANLDTIALNIPAGIDSVCFTVFVQDDMVQENMEQISFNIVELSNGLALGNNPQFDLMIQDNDPRIINFDLATLTVPEDTGTITFNLDLSFEALANGFAKIKISEGTNVDANDYSTNPIAISDTIFLSIAQGDTMLQFDVQVLDDNLFESTENINFEIVETSSDLMIGAMNSFDLNIESNDPYIPPFYNISSITTVNAMGIADSLGVNCQIQGIVLGVDLFGNTNSGNLFTLWDTNKGIAVFNSSGFMPPYLVNEGDELKVFGTISQFNGLTQITADSIEILSMGNAIPNPSTVFALDESTESKLVQINNVSLNNPSQWPVAGNNANLSISDGGNTYILRIDKDTDVDEKRNPNGSFSVIGIGSQFDSTTPLDSNYQIIPRYEADIIAANHDLLLPTNSSNILVQGPTNMNLDFSWSISNPSIGGMVFYEFILDSLNGDFSAPYLTLASNNAGNDTALNIDFATLDNFLDVLGIPIMGTLNAKWTVRATNNNYSGFAPEFTINLTRGVVAVEDLQLADLVQIYPNPTQNNLNIQFKENNFKPYELEFYKMNGQKVFKQKYSGNQRINLSSFANGVYSIKIIQNGKIQIERLVILK